MISNAEFRCAREYLGLTTQWMATRMGVGPRAVLRWESPGQKVPDKAAAVLEDLLDKAASEVERKVKTAVGLTVPAEMAWHGGDYPPTWHRAIAARVWLKRHNTSIEYTT